MKRISIAIQSKNNPGKIVTGYALSHEILANQVSFFAAQKFPVDEELTVFYNLNGEKQSVVVKMKHMHEQISSGKIMNALPTEDNPFPARKFYRCYTSVVGGEVAENTTGEENQVESVVQNEEVTAEASPEAVPEPVAEPTIEEAPAAKRNGIDAFAAEEATPFELPEVGDVGSVDMSVEEPKAA